MHTEHDRLSHDVPHPSFEERVETKDRVRELVLCSDHRDSASINKKRTGCQVRFRRFAFVYDLH